MKLIPLPTTSAPPPAPREILIRRNSSSNSSTTCLKVCHISDTHNLFFALPDGCDVLIHSGDMTDNGTPEEIAQFNRYLKQEVAPKFKACLVLCGNHESEIFREFNNSTSEMEKVLFDGLEILQSSSSSSTTTTTTTGCDDEIEYDLFAAASRKEEDDDDEQSPSSSCKFCLVHDRIVSLSGFRFGGTPWMAIGPWTLEDVDRRCEIFLNLLSGIVTVGQKPTDMSSPVIFTPAATVPAPAPAVNNTDKNEEDKKACFDDQKQKQSNDNNNNQKGVPIDVIITHTPPVGILDTWRLMPIGCRGLLKALKRFPESVVLSTFGHAHHGHGSFDLQLAPNPNGDELTRAFGVQRRPQQEEEGKKKKSGEGGETAKLLTVVCSNGSMKDNKEPWPLVYELKR